LSLSNVDSKGGFDVRIFLKIKVRFWLE